MSPKPPPDDQHPGSGRLGVKSLIWVCAVVMQKPKAIDSAQAPPATDQPPPDRTD